jgi:hypothetical protein
VTDKERSELTAYIMTLRPSLRAKSLRALLAAREEPSTDRLPIARPWRAQIHLGRTAPPVIIGYFQTKRSAVEALAGAERVAKALGHTGEIGTFAERGQIRGDRSGGGA